MLFLIYLQLINKLRNINNYLQNHMLQEHGLGARPYDCSKCTLKFFFRAELDHHILTFHRSAETVLSIEKAHETKDRNKIDKNCDENIMIKEEITHEGEEEEELNVDDQVGQEKDEKTSCQNEKQKLKTEANGEITSGKMES